MQCSLCTRDTFLETQIWCVQIKQLQHRTLGINTCISEEKVTDLKFYDFSNLYLKGGGRGATTTPGARIRTTTTLPPSE